MKRCSSVSVWLSFVLVGCHEKPPIRFSNILRVADPKSDRQLLAGFYEPEGGQWRWTKQRFAVVLQPPTGAEHSGATLLLTFSIPPSQIEKLGPITVSADVGDASLPPQTFDKAGTFTYARQIDRRLIIGKLLPVVFNVDKALSPWQADGRELAIVVSEVSLQ